MKLRSIFSGVLAFGLAVGMLWSQPVFAVAESASSSFSKQEKVVRVFFPLQTGFAQRDEKGNYSGYSYDFLMDIAQLTGWKYEFVAVEPTNENLQLGIDAVKSGELDLACTMTRLPTLQEDYLYSAKPYGAVNYTLAALESNHSLNNRTLSDYPDLRIALVKNATGQNELWDDYCYENGLSYQPIYAQNNNDCKMLLETGQADAMIAKDVSFLSGYKTVVKFSKQPFYFATSKDNQELMDELDRAFLSILSATPELQEQRYRSYFTKPSDYALSLTADELAYLEQAPVLRVAIMMGRAPIQDYDFKTDQFSGVMVDTISLLSQKSGLQFELLFAEDKASGLEMISSGKADILAGIPYSYAPSAQLDEYGVLLTSPVLSLPVVRASTLKPRVQNPGLLVYSDTRLFEERDDIRYEDDIDEILRLVESGAYAEAYVDGYISQHYLEQGHFQNVTLSITPYGNYPVCLGISRETDMRLINILLQAIAALTPSEIEGILYQNTSHSRRTDFVDFVKRNPTPFILGTIIVLVLVFGLLLALLMKTHRINRMITAEKSRYKALSQIDGLTRLLNHESFRSVVQRRIAEQSDHKGGTLLILDIDHFKQINDVYGHLAGDEALAGLAKLLQSVFRDGEIVGRIGGDEFGVLLPGVAAQSLVEERCKRLLLECPKLEQTFGMTLSIGAAIFRGAVDFDLLFSQADAALYEIKRKGRNGFQIDICEVNKNDCHDDGKNQ